MTRLFPLPTPCFDFLQMEWKISDRTLSMAASADLPCLVLAAGQQLCSWSAGNAWHCTFSTATRDVRVTPPLPLIPLDIQRGHSPTLPRNTSDWLLLPLKHQWAREESEAGARNAVGSEGSSRARSPDASPCSVGVHEREKQNLCSCDLNPYR